MKFVEASRWVVDAKGAMFIERREVLSGMLRVLGGWM